MNHPLFTSVEELLTTDTLSQLAKQAITEIVRLPLTSLYGRSGSRIDSITTNGGAGPRFILKRVSLDWDWLMRRTADYHCRSVTLWQLGLFDQLPPEVAHGVLACARDGPGWAILLQDVSEVLLPFARFAMAENSFILQAMAAFHAQFWQMSALHNPQLGLCHLAHMYQTFSPGVAQLEIGGENNIPRRVIEGWELAQSILPSDVWQILAALLKDPAPLCLTLEKYPFTLVHGDWRHANLAYFPETSQLFLLDWQLAMATQPAVEIARYLITNSPLLPVEKEITIEIYRQELQRRLGSQFSPDWWNPQLALGLLGGFLQDGWAVVLKASHWQVGEKHRSHWQADVSWWIERVRQGIDWLNPA